MFLVTGGINVGGVLDSTELYSEKVNSWKLWEPATLPSARWGLRAATVLNDLYVFGKTSKKLDI